jgi:ubiquitin C-terminal hydrolase
LLLFFFAFFFVAIDLFSLFHSSWMCNGRLLQLIECIESTQNEVKKKMSDTDACNRARRSRASQVRKKIAGRWKQFVVVKLKRDEFVRNTRHRNLAKAFSRSARGLSRRHETQRSVAHL